MGEFAAMGADGAIKAYDELKAAAAEIRDSISSNWVDHKNFTLEFPKEPLIPSAIGDVDSKYKWIPVMNYTFRGGYYSHIRATRKSQKKHAEHANTKTALEGKLTKSQRAKKARTDKLVAVSETVEDVKQKINNDVKKTLQTKYEQKFAKVKAANDAGKGKEFVSFVRHYNEKYGTDFQLKNLAQITNLTATKFAEDVTEKVLGSDKFAHKIEAAATKALHEAAIRAYKERRPDLTDDEIKKKVTNKVIKAISADGHLSVSIAYEVKYSVLKVDMAEAAERWAKLDKKITEAAGKKAAELNTNIKEVMESIRSAKETFGDDPDLVKEMTDGFKDDVKQLMAAKKKIESEIAADRAEMNSKRATMDAQVKEKRRIGAFAIYPIAEYGALKTAISWRNTDASMSAQPSFSPDGTVRVAFRWVEDGVVGVPFAKNIFHGHYSAMGGVTFDKDGHYTGDGKMGQRFQETCTMESTKA